ncbi:MAG: 4Fe-4S binding protein [Oscillospiraceae bacterium]|nr:4Fe-4S binding protein [Oscillospiraceae bacterium]
MLRKIIKIDSEKCNGCGACAKACHEGAIGMVNNKAVLLRDDYCDGLGDCLPACPKDAISFEMREAAAYDEAAVKAKAAMAHSSGCPGHAQKVLSRDNDTSSAQDHQKLTSRLGQWPVQIKLAAPNAAFFENSDLLIAADCTAYAYAGFHDEFIAGKVTLIGCPKLDDTDYSQKLGVIISNNNINSITVVRMEVPCCGGIEYAVKKALEASGKDIELRVVTVGCNGDIKE